jgi:hypothetical protein
MTAPAAAEPPTPPRPTPDLAERSYALHRLIDGYVERHPDVYPNPLLNAHTHAQVEQLRQMLRAVDRAMHDEGVDDRVTRRVAMRVLYGHPDGPDAIAFVNERELQQVRIRSDAAGKLLNGGDWTDYLDEKAPTARRDPEL